MPSRPLPPNRPVLVLLLSLLAACGGDDGTAPEPEPTLSVSASPSSLSVEQGQSGAVTISAIRGGGFDGSVTVTPSGLPAGVTAGPLTIAAGATSGDMVFTAASDATVGTANVTLTGTGSGVAPATTTVSLEVTEAPTGGFQLSMDPASVTIDPVPAASAADRAAALPTATSTVAIDRQSPFDGAVTLSVTDAPANLGTTLAETSVSGDETTLTVEALAGLAPGAYSVMLTGTADGVDDQTTTLQVTVSNPGGFTLSLDPASVEVEQGATAQTVVTIARQAPFDGPVTLALSGTPAGLTASLDATSVAGDQTTLAVEADAGLTPGSYSVTVTGTATGVADQSTELSVRVSEAGGGGMYTVAICDAEWVAVQDGSGPWERITATGDAYSFDASSDRIGLAWVQVLPGQFGVGEQVTTEVYYLDASQVPFFQDPCERVTGGKTITGTVAGLAGADFGSVQLGFVTGTVTPAMPSFTLENVPEGPLDLLVTRGTGDAGSFLSDRMIIRRDQDLPDGTNLTLDLDAPEAFALESGTVTLGGLGAGDYVFSTSFQTAGSFFLGSLGSRFNPASPVTVPVVPLGQRETGDLHTLVLGQEDRSVLRYASDPSGVTVQLGPPLEPVTVTSTATALGVYPSATFTAQAAYSEVWSVDFSQSPGFTGGIDVSLFATGEYVNGEGPQLAVPDFTAVDGWDDTWNLTTGSEITWSASAGNGFMEFAFPADGTVLGFGNASGTIDP